MILSKIFIENFRCLKDIKLSFKEDINIIVGDNETGKSSLLEAINLVLTGQMNGRSIQYELSPFLFNDEVVQLYKEDLIKSKNVEPPKIKIEAFLKDEKQFAELKGVNNSLKENVPGITILIEYDQEFTKEYEEYIKKPEEIKTIPVEYYKISWLAFSNNYITARSIPINVTFVDTTLNKDSRGADKYILKIIDDTLNNKGRADLALTFRKLKERFMEEKSILEINKQLCDKNEISDKKLSISVDISPRTKWESNLTPYLDEIPFYFIGKGEQNSVKMNLALESNIESHIFLIEEPENHLTYTNMNKIIKRISQKCKGKQLIITTHSTFVLNKLGIENLILFGCNKVMTVENLSEDTKNYFMKLPGYDTLRLILSKKSILVEGPSDELIVQRAYLQEYGKLPIENGVDVICVGSLAFKRFLEIARILNIRVDVITDNDGDINALKIKYREFEINNNIKINYDEDENYKNLEEQIAKINSLELLNDILKKDFSEKEKLIEYMQKNKTEYSLEIFSSDKNISIPNYIQNAIR